MLGRPESLLHRTSEGNNDDALWVMMCSGKLFEQALLG